MASPLLLVLLLGSAMLCGTAQGQAAPRFSRLSSCLGTLGSSSRCVTCRTQVTVDAEEGADCSRTDRSLEGRTCSRLEDVIESIAMRETEGGGGGCVGVLVQPRPLGMAHVVLARENRVLTQNIVIRGTDQQRRSRITLINDMGGMDEASPTERGGADPAGGGGNDMSSSLYSLRFDNELTVLESLQFVGSNGSVAFENVAVVAIENSAFRFFTKGAVDVYNSPTVLVSGSEFAHNSISFVSKADPYRGHSAGLSIGYNQNTLSVDDLGALVRITFCTFRNNSVETEPVATTPDVDRTGFGDENSTMMENGVNGPLIIPGNNRGDNNNGDNNNNNNNNKPPPKSLQTESQRFDTRGQLFGDEILVGRGGGVAIIINADAAADVEVMDCVFLGNVAVEFGGGLYLLLRGQTSHQVEIMQNRFVGNVCPSTGGGFHFTYLSESESLDSMDSQVLVHSNEFSQNQADYGGGAFFLPLTFALVTSDISKIGVFVSFLECTFEGNSAMEAGGALGVGFTLPMANQLGTRPLEIRDCYFDSNFVVGGGIVSIANFPASFRGDNMFSQNRGPSLAVISSLVRVFGLLQFVNNSNTNSLDGGAMFITSLGQLQLNPNTRVVFRNNSGVLGAAIVIQNTQLSSSFSRLATNPLCAVLFSERLLPPDMWANRNVSVLMDGNSAVVSSGVNVNNINRCSWVTYRFPYFDREGAFRWNFMSYRNNQNSAHGNQLAQRFAVQTPPVNVRIGRGNRRNRVAAYPGETVNLAIFAVDELGTPTSAVVDFADDSQSSFSGSTQSVELYRFSPSSVSLDRVSPDFRATVRYGVQDSSTSAFPEEVISVKLVGTLKSRAETRFLLDPTPCPPGRKVQQLSSGFSECSCNTERTDIVECSDSIITMDNLLWGYSTSGLLDNSSTMTNDFKVLPFHTFPCPHQYCRCAVKDTAGVRKCNFNFNDQSPGGQCLCNRTGILCGDCTEGSGFSVLLDRCVSCDPRSATLVLGLIIADIIVIAVLLVFMFPVLAWLYPVVFYLQILPHLTKHFPVTFNKLSPLLFYVSSALGLYFPYDFCVHSNMDAAAAYALHYNPVLVALVVTPVILYIRLKKFPGDWHGVWFLVLLLYTPLLHTSITLLDCPALEGDGSGYTPRWYVNGNIRCFQDGRHAPLGLFAIFMLLCCLSLIPLVVAIATKKLTTPYWMHCLVQPLTDSYKDRFLWWSGVELGKRVLIVLFAVAFKKDDYAVIFTLVVMVTGTGFLKPYKSMLANVLDVALGVDTFILLALRNTVDLEDILHIMPAQSLGAKNNTCAEPEGHTPFALLLIPFYYLPLLVALLALIVWTASLLRRMWNMPMLQRKEKPVSPTSPLELGPGARTRTETVVDIREYKDEECGSEGGVSDGGRRASFKVQQARVTWSSVKRRLGRTLSRHQEYRGTEEVGESIKLQDLKTVEPAVAGSECSTESGAGTGRTLLTTVIHETDTDDSYSNI